MSKTKTIGIIGICVQKSSVTHSKRHRAKEKHAKAYAPWSEEDDEKLKQLYREGKSVEEMMEIFERNRGAIRSRIRKLGLEG